MDFWIKWGHGSRSVFRIGDSGHGYKDGSLGGRTGQW